MVQIDESDHSRKSTATVPYYNTTDSYAFNNILKHSQGISFEKVLFFRFHFNSTPSGHTKT